MKNLFLLLLLLWCFTLQLAAQTKAIQASKATNPLIGTWMEQTDALREIKLITPTHFSFIVFDAKADTFMYAGIGTYTLEKGKYVENLQVANFKTASTRIPFDYRVEGDKFHQQGSLTMADGTKEDIKHTFSRVNLPAQQSEAIGTWNRISAMVTDSAGKRVMDETLQEDTKEFMTITPTHWYSMKYNATTKKMIEALVFTYTKKADTHLLKVQESSFKIPASAAATRASMIETIPAIALKITVEGDKMRATYNSGATRTDKAVEVYQRVGGKTPKIVSAK
jgi:hypothetical protein